MFTLGMGSPPAAASSGGPGRQAGGYDRGRQGNWGEGCQKVGKIMERFSIGLSRNSVFRLPWGAKWLLAFGTLRLCIKFSRTAGMLWRWGCCVFLCVLYGHDNQNPAALLKWCYDDWYCLQALPLDLLSMESVRGFAKQVPPWGNILEGSQVVEVDTPKIN